MAVYLLPLDEPLGQWSVKGRNWNAPGFDYLILAARASSPARKSG